MRFGKRIRKIERNPNRTVHRNEENVSFFNEFRLFFLFFRSERERWIREKYEQKLFLIPLSLSTDQIRQTLIDAIEKQDLPTVILLLAHGKLSIEDLNSFVHLAASTGNITILQLLLWVLKIQKKFFGFFRQSFVLFVLERCGSVCCGFERSNDTSMCKW